MKPGERAVSRAGDVLRKLDDRWIRFRQRRLAQEQRRRKSLESAAHDTGEILSFNLSGDADAELRERSVHRECVRQVPERIFVGLEAAILRDVDAPTNDVLAVVIPRSQTQ